MPLKKVPTDKIFIIGLPRTGTTSICSALLHLGFNVAHTAYTARTFEQARVIADTPIFCDYPQLDLAYPGAKFIYLERVMDKWLPSIQQLLLRMHDNLVRDDGGFNPIIKRCYQQSFAPFTYANIEQISFLQACYQRHQLQVSNYFNDRPNDLLCLDISKPQSYLSLLAFLGIENPLTPTQPLGFERLNVGGKVTAWKDIKNDLKIASTNKGKVTKLPYSL